MRHKHRWIYINYRMVRTGWFGRAREYKFNCYKCGEDYRILASDFWC